MLSKRKQKLSDSLLWWCGSSLLLVIGLIITTGIRTCLAASQSTQLQLASIYVQSQKKELKMNQSETLPNVNVSKTNIYESSNSENMNDSKSSLVPSESSVNDISVSKETPVEQDTQDHPSSAVTICDTDVYVVESGDTLLSISVKTNVSLRTIICLNNITNPNYIYAGQILYLTEDAMVQSNGIVGCN